MTRYFVTGGTGLVGRFVVERLFARGGQVTLMVRADAEERRAEVLAKLRAAAAEHAAEGASLELVVGDLGAEGLGLGEASAAAFDHVVHAAALYDLAASAERLREINVEGTRRLLSWLDGFGGTLHHVSSVAVAGDHGGTFGEDDFDLGQSHPHPYHATKFESERLVRQAIDAGLRARIYRPGAVVGHSQTGEMDKVDGPYYFFKPIKAARDALPRWIPLVGWIDGCLNIVPVDWVAAAIDTLMHRAEGDGQAFHIVDPTPPRFHETFNLFADIAGAPRIRANIGKTLLRFVPGGAQMISQLGSVKILRDHFLRDFDIPPEVHEALNTKVRFGTERSAAAMAAADLPCPAQKSYAKVIWDYWAAHLDPDRDPDERRRHYLSGKAMLITGASSGVGAELAVLAAGYGAKVLLVARREDKLAEVAERAREAGGQAEVRAADLSALDDCDAVVEWALGLGDVDILVNNAARSIRRPSLESLERFHDYERVMQLNYFAPLRLIRGVLPAMRERGEGHIVNVLTAGVALPTPNFSAYGGSKAALSHVTDTLAAEHLDAGIEFTGVYLPWVRTPMMDATGAFKETKAMTPAKAALWMLDGMIARRRHVITSEGKRRWVFNGLAPSTLTRIVNLVYRIDSDEPDKHPELALDRTLLKQFVKGRLM